MVILIEIARNAIDSAELVLAQTKTTVLHAQHPFFICSLKDSVSPYARKNFMEKQILLHVSHAS